MKQFDIKRLSRLGPESLDAFVSKVLSKLLFHTSGKPRGVFRKYILRPNGLPRSVFYRWMSGQSYQELPAAVRVPSQALKSPCTMELSRRGKEIMRRLQSGENIESHTT
jgi:hypothetical protein